MTSLFYNFKIQKMLVSLISIVVISIVVASLLTACNTTNKESHPVTPDSTESGAPDVTFAQTPVKLMTFFTANPFSSAKTFNLTPPTQLANTDTGSRLNPNTSWQWALSQSDLMLHKKSALLQRVAVSRGALPEPLVPSIRSQIAANPSLQVLMQLPADLSGLLGSLFTDDGKINDEIRSGLQSKLQQFTPGGTNLGSNLAFRFFAFPEFPDLRGNVAVATQKTVNSFQLSELVTRWNLVLSPDSLWLGKGHLAFGDHGLQTLETMRLLMEWQYLLGLEKNSRGGFYGGLTLNADDLSDPTLYAYNPKSSAPQKPPYLGSNYIISYPQNSSLNMAIHVQEHWTVTTKSIHLDEQARLWETAARAFSRMRPSKLSNAKSLFGNGRLFPAETYQMPLIFLAGASSLLDGPFINKDTRLIREDAAQDGAASLPSLARLAQSLNSWMKELTGTDDLQMDQATKSQLSQARDRLRPALQLSVQTILKDHIGESQKTTFGRPLLQEGVPVKSIALASETIRTLAQAEQDSLKSPLLRQRIVALTHWLVGSLVAPAWQRREINALDALWLKLALDSASRYPEINKTAWFQPLQGELDEMLEAFDKS
jgi:hypothetical protein